MSIFRNDLLEGKVALITGGGTGIGRGITIGLAAHGAHTVIVSRKLENLEPTAQVVTSQTKRQCVPMTCDVRQPERVDEVIAATIEKFGRLDILINNAAGNFVCPAAALSPNGFGTVIDIDTKGTWHMSRSAYLQWMRDHGGNIVNISATLHYGGTPAQLHVSAAKAAIDAMTRNLAVEWGPSGVRVNAIAPGPIAETEGANRLFGDAAAAEKMRKSVPLQRLGLPEDVSNLCLFVVSEAARNISGAILVTDGGLWLNNMGDRMLS